VATPSISPPALGEHRSWRWAKDRIATGLMAVTLILVAIPLVLVLWTVVQRGAGVIGLSFLTGAIPPQISPDGGMGPAVLGTLEITALATLLAVPLGVLGAVYLNEYGKRSPLARLVRFLSYVMTGVPSIVMGLFVFTLWVLRFGFSGLAGALALACLMLPIVIRSSEEMLALVPDTLREASYALGATRARVTLTVALPSALPGIVSGALLAVARAAGETAPLLFTILTVTEANPNVFRGANTALSTQIFANAQAPFPGAQTRAWGAALTLVGLAFALTIVARLVTARVAQVSR
jgi:phosphate transport system permease protein